MIFFTLCMQVYKERKITVEDQMKSRDFHSCEDKQSVLYIAITGFFSGDRQKKRKP